MSYPDIFDAQPPDDDDENKPIIYFGRNPTRTEALSGTAVYKDREPWKPLQPGLKGHQTLQALAALITDSGGQMGRWTAYEVSRRLCGDGHGARRELKRLEEREPPLVCKDGEKTNVGVVVNGRENVDAYAMTIAGWRELDRLNREPPKKRKSK